MIEAWLGSSAVSAASLAALVVRATLVLAIGLVAARLAVRGRAALRHLCLVAALGGVLLLPFVTALVPPVQVEVATPAWVATAIVPPAAVPTADSAPPLPRVAAGDRLTAAWPGWRPALLMAWGAGSALLVAALLLDALRLRRLARSAIPWIGGERVVDELRRERGLRRAIGVTLHDALAAPITFGVRHPVVMLPAASRSWAPEELQRALVHEIEHVRRYDWVTQLLARCAAAAYWFIPLVWIAERRLLLEAERACDDAVLATGDRAAYAAQLVALAERWSGRPAPAVLGMAKRSDLSTRVRALLSTHERRGPVSIAASIVALVAAAIVLSVTASAHAVFLPGDAAVTVATAEPQRAASRGARRALNAALIEAAEKGDVAEMAELIAEGADVNGAVDGDGSPLIAAARSGHMAAVRELLDRGADVNLGVPGDGSPLIMAARRGDVAIVTLLLDKGAAIDQVVDGDENALIQAAENGHLEVVRLLVARGADVNARVWVESPVSSGRGEWRTPWEMASRGRHHAVVAFLRQSGAREP